MKTGNTSRRNNNDVISGPGYCPGQDRRNVTEDPCRVNNTVCLRGGSTDSEGIPFSGNVMVGGAPVCDDSWGMEDGLVACRELSYHGVLRVTRESQFGQVNI